MTFKLFFILFSIILQKISGTDFGYIASSTRNIGDDIQAIAAKRLLPKTSILIDRDLISEFQYDSKICAILNGWYMHPQSFFNHYENQEKKYYWPPSSTIDPLLISIHFTFPFVSTVLSSQNIAYLITNGPVGARDYFTLRILQSRHIPCYFSGCLTLTLNRSLSQKEDIIYAVDLDEECIDFLRTKTKYPIKVISHEINKDLAINLEERMNYAEKLLEKYQTARCVVTSRLHAAMPCLAFETPVLLINTQGDQYRFDGLRELVRNCNREEFLKDSHSFNFNDPEENPKLYLPIRENLLNNVHSWLAKKLGEQ